METVGDMPVTLKRLGRGGSALGPIKARFLLERADEGTESL